MSTSHSSSFSTDFMMFQIHLTDEEKLVKQSAREFVNKEVLPIIEKHAQDQTFPRDLIVKMGSLGFLDRHFLKNMDVLISVLLPMVF